jgi:hypothetical protein
MSTDKNDKRRNVNETRFPRDNTGDGGVIRYAERNNSDEEAQRVTIFCKENMNFYCLLIFYDGFFSRFLNDDRAKS